MSTSFGASASGKERPGANLQPRARLDDRSEVNDTSKRTNRLSILGKTVALMGHTTRFMRRSFLDGLSMHGECHHGFPPHPQRNTLSDEP
jgi:hypothetical protein